MADNRAYQEVIWPWVWLPYFSQSVVRRLLLGSNIWSGSLLILATSRQPVR